MVEQDPQVVIARIRYYFADKGKLKTLVSGN